MRNTEKFPRTMSVTIPRDEKGFISRQCLVEACVGVFKIELGTGLKGEHLPCRCPYCGHSDESTAFTTPTQIEHAKSVALDRFTAAFLKDLKSMERKVTPRGPFGIGISIKVKGEPHPIHHFRDPELETEVVCSGCTLHYAIYGAFGFCPDCGMHNSLQILEKNLEIARKKIALAAGLDGEMADELVCDALDKIVSAFDGFGRETCRINARHATDPAKAENISFQNPNSARDRIRSLFGFDMSDGITPKDWQFIYGCFQKRHLIKHRAGVVDQKYLDETGDSHAVLGRKIQLATEDVIAASNIIGALGTYLVAQLAPAAPATPAASPPAVLSPPPPPADPLPGFGLSHDAQRVAVLLNEKAERGAENDDFFQVPDLLQELNMTEEDLDIALDELNDRDWVILHQGSRGDSRLGYFMVSTKAQLFFDTDKILPGCG
jgi:hypothetical protein